MQVVVAVPIKPFDAAKQRLSDVLAPQARRRLSIGLADHTMAAVEATGATPLVLSADDEVTAWAEREGLPVLVDAGSSLGRAAHGALAWAAYRNLAWAVCHADLPLLQPADIETAVELISAGQTVLAPSSDGGTSLVGGPLSAFDFAYGIGSFHRHLARLAGHGPVILNRLGFLLDLDHPTDLRACASHPHGAWLGPFLDVASTP